MSEVLLNKSKINTHCQTNCLLVILTNLFVCESEMGKDNNTYTNGFK